MLQRVLILLLLVARGASAHDCWIEPVDPHPMQDVEVQVRLLVGEPGQGEAFPRRAEKVVRFVARGPKGELPIQGADGEEPAGRFRIGRGVHVLSYRNRPSVIELEAGKFEEYLREEGLEEVSRLRAGRGETGKVGRERYSRCCKSIVAGEEPGGAGWETPLGDDLELVPEKNPLLLAPGDELPLRVLLRGQPLAGAKVAAWSRARFDLRTSGRTDAEGRVRLRLPAGGRWVVTCVRMQATTDGGPQDWESLWSSLSFVTAGYGPRFQVDVAAVHSAALNGCALGELDGVAESELVAVAKDGAIVVSRLEPRAWRSEVAAVATGELLGVATGELDGVPGDEVVVVGALEGPVREGVRGVALLLQRAGTEWRLTRLVQDDGLLRAAAIVDGQLFLAGSRRQVLRLRRDPQGSGWIHDVVGALPGLPRAASGARTSGSGARAAGGVAFACEDGSVVLARPAAESSGAWALQVVDQRPRPRARLHAGSAAILVADDDGLLTVVSPRHQRWTVFEAGTALRGAASGQLDLRGSQHQMTVAGANGEMTHAWLKDGQTDWTREVVAKDGAELRDLAFGQVVLTGQRPQPCVVVASASGRLLALRRPE